MENEKSKNNQVKKVTMVVGIIIILLLCLSRCSFGLSRETPNNEKEPEIIDKVEKNEEKNDEDNKAKELDIENKEEVKVSADDKKDDTPSNDNSSTKPADSNNNSNDASTPSAPDTPSKPEKPGHTHRYDIPVHETIHHDEVGHTEKVCVKDAWDEPVYEEKQVGYTCNQCKQIFYGSSSIFDHFDNSPDCGGYTPYYENVQTGTTHHDAVYEDKWIVDQAAWDEEIVAGYKCSCGATK